MKLSSFQRGRTGSSARLAGLSNMLQLKTVYLQVPPFAIGGDHRAGEGKPQALHERFSEVPSAHLPLREYREIVLQNRSKSDAAGH